MSGRTVGDGVGRDEDRRARETVEVVEYPSDVADRAPGAQAELKVRAQIEGRPRQIRRRRRCRGRLAAKPPGPPSGGDEQPRDAREVPGEEQEGPDEGGRPELDALARVVRESRSPT